MTNPRSPCVLVVGGDPLVKEMFWSRGWGCVDEKHMEIEGIPDIGLVCFTGGEDINPEVYGEAPAGARGWNDSRDGSEIATYHQFVGKVPLVGICRGGQLLNVLNGGTLIQDHGLVSGIVTPIDTDGERCYTLVDHHQGIIRNPDNSLSILAFDMFAHSGWLEHPQGPGVGLTYACLYPETQSLCFQPHPEWGHAPTRELFFDLIETYLL